MSSLQKRKSHNKSRRGCLSCKKRHVKCDEQGPPCVNCVIRKTTCEYPPSSSTRAASRSTAIARRAKNSDSTSECSELSQSDSPLNSPSRSISFSPLAFSSTSESRRFLELELMHQWSTRTWMTLYCVPEDQYYAQCHLPRSGLRSNYLMSGILALAATDLARCSQGKDSAKYLYAALEYYNEASADFRIQLANVNPDNIDLLYYFGSMAGTIQFLLPNQPPSSIDRFVRLFEMLLGAFKIVKCGIRWLLEGPTSFKRVIDLAQEPVAVTDPDSIIALDRLASVSSQLMPELDHEVTEDGELPDLKVLAYRVLITQLRVCFAEDELARMKCYWMSVVTVGGWPFTKALTNREPLALFIMLHVAVLLNRSSKDSMAWWLGGLGPDLLEEISDLLQQSPVAEIPEGLEAIDWARSQRKNGLRPIPYRLLGWICLNMAVPPAWTKHGPLQFHASRPWHHLQLVEVRRLHMLRRTGGSFPE